MLSAQHNYYTLYVKSMMLRQFEIFTHHAPFFFFFSVVENARLNMSHKLVDSDEFSLIKTYLWSILLHTTYDLMISFKDI